MGSYKIKEWLKRSKGIRDFRMRFTKEYRLSTHVPKDGLCIEKKFINFWMQGPETSALLPPRAVFSWLHYGILLS